MTRPTHANKAIEAAVRQAEARGWRYKAAGKSAHCWGRLLCAEATPAGCQMSVWSTPKSADNHAKQILRMVKRCPHC